MRWFGALVKARGFLLLVLLVWTVGFFALSERVVIPPKKSCVQLQKIAVQISVNEATGATPALARIRYTQGVRGKDLARYSECRGIASLDDGSTVPVGFYYRQNEKGTRIYTLERYGNQGEVITVQSMPRGEVEYEFRPPTPREHAYLLGAILFMLVVYILRKRVWLVWWSEPDQDVRWYLDGNRAESFTMDQLSRRILETFLFE